MAQQFAVKNRHGMMEHPQLCVHCQQYYGTLAIGKGYNKMMIAVIIMSLCYPVVYSL